MSHTKPQPVWILKHTFCDGTDVITAYSSHEALLLRLTRILDHACEDSQYHIEVMLPNTEEQEQKMLDDHLKWKAERAAK